MKYRYDCIFFDGYKPCKYKRPCAGCPHHRPAGGRILIISLDAMGAVLRATCLLAPIRRAFPGAHITWLTLPACEPLLRGNDEIDRLLTWDETTSVVLQRLRFDALFAVDKSLAAGALAEQVVAERKWGFGLTKEGQVRPLSAEADYQYAVGLDDELKFRRNRKPETQMITETMGLPWQRDPYILQLSSAEERAVLQRRRELLSTPGTAAGSRIIGFNTGCSQLFPYKKFTVPRARELVALWRERFPQHVVALLGGGPEDRQRQAAIKEAFASDPGVVDTPTRDGLREGILWLDTADLVFSGCSLGMHLAIARRKEVVAWFGVSCIQEIDLYDRGVKIQSPVPCSPCWRQSCSQDPKCFDQVPLSEILAATAQRLAALPAAPAPPARVGAGASI